MDGCGFTASSVLYRDLLYMYVDQTLHWIIWNKISSDEHSSLVILRESNRDLCLVYDILVIWLGHGSWMYAETIRPESEH